VNAFARTALYCGALCAAMLAGWLAYRSMAPESDPDIRPLMAVSYPDLSGSARNLGEWRGKVLVVNFWATWCPPCLKEIPEFVRMQEKMRAAGVQFVGIAADHPDKVRPFAAKYGINYPVLLAGMDVIGIARLAGNAAGGLPFTVIIDRQGRWVRSASGALDERTLAGILQPLLRD
jgi:thiol-disulfide isomerase/thioredoxin